VKNEKITVYVNDQPKELFVGMRVRNAIGSRARQRVQAHRALIRDADGNRVDVDGALHDGERLYLAPMDPQTFADEVQERA
jgi:hypothetical protein